LTPEELYNLATAANKYDCADVMKYMAHNWKRKICKDMPYSSNMALYPRLLAACFVFNDAEGCEAVSCHYMQDLSGRVTELDPEVANVVPRGFSVSGP